MRRRHFIALTGVALAAGCASRLNPLNWFGRSRRVETVAAEVPAPDPRPLVRQIIRLQIDRHPSGAIVRATGLPETQGWYDARLVRVPSSEAGVLSYQLRAWPPPVRGAVSTSQSRELVVATYLNRDALAAVREIRVSAAENALSSRR